VLNVKSFVLSDVRYKKAPFVEITKAVEVDRNSILLARLKVQEVEPESTAA
jgi:hypothetical protein